jgi:hypothetical protein
MILSVREQIEESKAALIYASDQVSAYLAFRHWIATEEGQRLWQATCPKLSWICISHALAQTKATCFGLLLTQRGAIIWSKYSHRAFTRRAPLYEEAAHTGLCFWWDRGIDISRQDQDPPRATCQQRYQLSPRVGHRHGRPCKR